MNKVDFFYWLKNEFNRYPVLAKAKSWSFNALCYVLRMSGRDFSVSYFTPDRGGAFPSVQRDYIPSWCLPLKIKDIDYEHGSISARLEG